MATAHERNQTPGAAITCHPRQLRVCVPFHIGAWVPVGILISHCSWERLQMDVECASWLVECEVPFAIVFTKASTSRWCMPNCSACWW
jgi:hypothetical protein